MKRKGRGKYGRRKLEVSTCGTAVGAKQGSVKGNWTAKLSKQKRKERMRNQPGKKWKDPKNERTEGAPEKPL